MNNQLPETIMKKAVKGINSIGHPLRLRILEYIDVKGKSCVSSISNFLNIDQTIISQNLKKMKDYKLLKNSKEGNHVYYELCGEYPASIFVCIRKLFAVMSNKFSFLNENYKEILPEDYTTMVANRIKLFANYDKMRILEYLILNPNSNVSSIVKNINSNQIKVSLLSTKYALQREMLNKFTFISNILFMILNNASFIVQWIILYSLKDDVGGYTLKQVLLLWGFAASTYGLSHFIFKEVICS